LRLLKLGVFKKYSTATTSKVELLLALQEISAQAWR